MGTKTFSRPLGGTIHVDDVVSAANTLSTLSATTATRESRRFLYAIVKYSGVPVHTGCTVELDSALGATYDTILETGPANAQSTVLKPPANADLIFGDGDAIKVTAPAGGGVLVSAITIYTEET